MRFSLRLALIATAAAVAPILPALAQPAAPPPAVREHVWAQTYSDLPIDPQIQTGVLPNGMRYAIQHNRHPQGRGSVAPAYRLRLAGRARRPAGPRPRAGAHGLPRVGPYPRRRHDAHPGAVGLGFGADTNAFTSFDETVYQFDIPHNDPASVAEGLLLMRDIGGELLLQPDALQPERGVVLAEERLRDTPDFEAFKSNFAFELPGQLAPDRLPIGKVDVVRNAPIDLIRQFYRANYRPDRATLVVTGDVDPAVMARQIEARFGDWRPVGDATPEPQLGAPSPRGMQTHLVVRYGVSPTISLAWVRPFDDAPDTMARERRDLVRNVALAALNQRFARLAAGPNPPFLAAGAGKSNEERSAWIATLSVRFEARNWRPALAAALRTQRQALRYGFSQAEVDRQAVEMIVAFRNGADSAAARRTPALANELVRTVNDQDVATSPAQDLITVQSALAGLKAADVDAALREIFAGPDPLVMMSTPEAPQGGEAALTSAFRQAEAAPIDAPTVVADKRWSHTTFGPPGQVVERRTEADLGVTFIRFANGVRLTIKPTSFSKDQAEVAVYFGDGRLSEAKDRPSPSWADSAFIAGGLTDLTSQDLQQVLADKTYSVALSTDDDAFLLHGHTRPKDLDTQLQVLAAYMTAPGWRPEAFTRVKEALGVALRQAPATPQGVQATTLAALQHSGDGRWTVPTLDQVSQTRLEDLKAELQPALDHGAVEVILAGDVSVDSAIAQVGAVFGALPTRKPDPIAPGQDAVRFQPPP